MRDSSKAALGGMIAALGVVLMLVTYLSPVFVYTAPQFAGLLLIVLVLEINGKWAFGCYTAISLLSVFLIADKEAAVYFTVFFGYYPILREALLRRIKQRWLCFILGLLVFNAAIAAGMFAAQKLFAVDYSELADGGKAFIGVFWGLMNVLFALYDYLIGVLIRLYQNKLQKRVRALFRH